jgi:hypothetical protein
MTRGVSDTEVGKLKCVSAAVLSNLKASLLKPTTGPARLAEWILIWKDAVTGPRLLQRSWLDHLFICLAYHQ